MKITKTRLRELVIEELTEGSYGSKAYNRDDMAYSRDDMAYNRDEEGRGNSADLQKILDDRANNARLTTKSGHRKDAPGIWLVKVVGKADYEEYPNDDEGFAAALFSWFRKNSAGKPVSMYFERDQEQI
jgi:hypothetical protein